jgi:hypothetical protein
MGVTTGGVTSQHWPSLPTPARMAVSGGIRGCERGAAPIRVIRPLSYQCLVFLSLQPAAYLTMP